MKMHAKDFPGSPVVNTALPLQGEPIRSLVREIRSRMPRDEAKNKQKNPTKWKMHAIFNEMLLGQDCKILNNWCENSKKIDKTSLGRIFNSILKSLRLLTRIFRPFILNSQDSSEVFQNVVNKKIHGVKLQTLHRLPLPCLLWLKKLSFYPWTSLQRKQ